MPTAPKNPHDTLFKHAFGDIDSARSLLQSLLPLALTARLDWGSLRLESETFVDERLRDLHADLLFSVRCDGHDAFVYVLLEHQSSPDGLMAFRMLRYVVRIWDEFLRSHAEARRLPAVLPVVVHHGESGWTSPTELLALIDLDATTLPDVAPFLPCFRFVLDDLAHVSEPELFARSLTALARAALLLLRNARRRSPAELATDLTRWAATFLEVFDAPSGTHAFEALVRYTLAVSKLEPESLRSFTHQLGPQVEEHLMTTLEKLQAEGEARGLAKGEAKGKAEGKAELVLKQLALRFGGMPEGVEQRVRHATLDELDTFAERVLSATALDDVVR
jgi:predicted transposase/invertase (TIGR01784 family)